MKCYEQTPAADRVLPSLQTSRSMSDPMRLFWSTCDQHMLASQLLSNSDSARSALHELFTTASSIIASVNPSLLASVNSAAEIESALARVLSESHLDTLASQCLTLNTIARQRQRGDNTCYADRIDALISQELTPDDVSIAESLPSLFGLCGLLHHLDDAEKSILINALQNAPQLQQQSQRRAGGIINQAASDLRQSMMDALGNVPSHLRDLLNRGMPPELSDILGGHPEEYGGDDYNGDEEYNEDGDEIDDGLSQRLFPSLN